ncbi:extracellular solute-binding protein [Halanaerobacter jeridensis]|uniref:Arabinogalactan oligomer/maltooligosaccharide transport system substrate-binding protein n=1 Tax=Halanaerobacter jeridensis TaxID=706427 RepID=A0A938XXQ4_9FIRM|nr:extracellular solute-binding protein [Halanaerobacter jeridensis]MBM7557582.1 arabinogalactan oligomer/maltooligosaccharide transport system substrate-binding protein [Halanaerobacter jeridensis]
MNKRLIGIVVAMVMVLGVLVTSAVYAQPDSLEIWVPSGPEHDWMQDMADKYQNQTGIKIEIGVVEELDQAQRLSLDGPSGKGADVVAWPHDKLGKSIKQGLIAPIKSYLPSGYAEENFADNPIKSLTYNGKLYGLPYAFQTTALVYNKDKYNSIPDTMMGLMKKAQKMTNESKNEYGLLYKIGDFYFSGGFFFGYGAYVFKEEAGGGYDIDNIGIGSQEAVEAANFLKKFRNMGLIPKGTTGQTANGLFMEGKNAAIIMGPWMLKDFKEAGINMGVKPLPKLPNGKYPKQFTGTKGYYVSKFSDNKQAAADFIKFLTNAENSMNHYQENNIIAPHVKVVNSSEFKNDELLYPFYKQAQRGKVMPSVPAMSTVWNPVNNAIDFVINGKAPAKQIMPMTEQQIKQGIQLMGR